jgi:hypothetical protein
MLIIPIQTNFNLDLIRQLLRNRIIFQTRLFYSSAINDCNGLRIIKLFNCTG